MYLIVSPQTGSMVFLLRDDFFVLICLPATTRETLTYGTGEIEKYRSQKVEDCLINTDT